MGQVVQHEQDTACPILKQHCHRGHTERTAQGHRATLRRAKRRLLSFGPGDARSGPGHGSLTTLHRPRLWLRADLGSPNGRCWGSPGKSGFSRDVSFLQGGQGSPGGVGGACRTPTLTRFQQQRVGHDVLELHVLAPPPPPPPSPAADSARPMRQQGSGRGDGRGQPDRGGSQLSPLPRYRPGSSRPHHPRLARAAPSSVPGPRAAPSQCRGPLRTGAHWQGCHCRRHPRPAPGRAGR